MITFDILFENLRCKELKGSAERDTSIKLEKWYNKIIRCKRWFNLKLSKVERVHTGVSWLLHSSFVGKNIISVLKYSLYYNFRELFEFIEENVELTDKMKNVIYYSALKGNNLQVAKKYEYFIDFSIKKCGAVCMKSVMNDNLDILKYLVELDVEIDRFTLALAAYQGSLNVFCYLDGMFRNNFNEVAVLCRTLYGESKDKFINIMFDNFGIKYIEFIGELIISDYSDFTLQYYIDFTKKYGINVDYTKLVNGFVPIENVKVLIENKLVNMNICLALIDKYIDDPDHYKLYNLLRLFIENKIFDILIFQNDAVSRKLILNLRYVDVIDLLILLDFDTELYWYEISRNLVLRNYIVVYCSYLVDFNKYFSEICISGDFEFAKIISVHYYIHREVLSKVLKKLESIVCESYSDKFSDKLFNYVKLISWLRSLIR
jgi:hypothetical protein